MIFLFWVITFRFQVNCVRGKKLFIFHTKAYKIQCDIIFINFVEWQFLNTNKLYEWFDNNSNDIIYLLWNSVSNNVFFMKLPAHFFPFELNLHYFTNQQTLNNMCFSVYTMVHIVFDFIVSDHIIQYLMQIRTKKPVLFIWISRDILTRCH